MVAYASASGTRTAQTVSPAMEVEPQPGQAIALQRREDGKPDLGHTPPTEPPMLRDHVATGQAEVGAV